MNAILICSLIVRLAAAILSFLLLRRVRDWRMGFLSLMLVLMVIGQFLHTMDIQHARGHETVATELPGLLVGIMALLSVFFVEKVIERRRRAEIDERRHSSILERVSSGGSLREVLEIVVRGVEESRPGWLCSVLLVDEKNGCLRHGAGPSLGDDFSRSVDGLPIGPNVGSCGACAFSGKRVVVEDILQHPNWASSRELSKRFGVRASWSEPIVSGQGEILGTFAMYHPQPRSPRADDLDAIRSAAQLAAIAIERQRSQDALRHGEELHRVFLENCQGLIGTHDLDGNLLSVNRAGALALGYEPEELVGTSIRHLLAPAVRGGFDTYIDGVRRNPATEGIMRTQGRDGQERFWLYRNRRYEPADSVPYVLCHAQDITELRRAQVSVKERTAYLRTLIESSPLAITVVDPQNRVELCNPAFEQLFEFSQQDVLGRDIDRLITPSALAEEAQVLTTKVLDGETVQTCTKRQNKLGRLLDVEVLGVPLMKQDRLVGIYVIYQDITERRQLEEQLREYQKMEAVGRLAGGIAHDFNNLLTIIHGYAQLVVQRSEDEDQQRNAGRIQEAADRATSLVQQLLAFSRKQVLKPRPLDINTIVLSALPMLRRIVTESTDLKVDLQDDLPNTMADPGQLEQVLVNLVLNAREATSGKGRIAIETRRINLSEARSWDPNLPPGEYVILKVSDNGKGMDAETLSRIFEPFYTTKEAGDGSGLGLSIVYGIVKQSDGSIHAESKIGKGSTFSVYLPARTADDQKRKASTTVRPVAQCSETVLVVEDETGVRQLTRQILELKGYRVLEAENARRALRLAETFPDPIDLLVTDVVMPKLNGDELASRLKKIRPNLKVMFMSGYADSVIAEHGVLEPGTPFLQKPFSLEELASKVRETLDLK